MIINAEKSRIKEIKNVLVVITAKMSIPLYLVFLIADYLYVPHLLPKFMVIRLCIIPMSLIVRHYIKTITDLNKLQYLALSLVAINCIPITVMIYMIKEASTPYYAGLNLVALGAISFIPWTKRFLFFVVALIYLPFIAIIPFNSRGINDLKGFIINIFFIVGTITISLVISYFNEIIRKNEIEAKNNLANEIVSRDTIIKKKTEDAIKIANLTKQFSPQVVQAITAGKLDITHSIKRAKICAIFVDIVNSTDRVARIDKDDLNKVLSMFMSDTMKVLLKYDITIDKFLGDGVLAFSGAPLDKKDFIKMVVDAALEIKGRIIGNRDQYIELWLNELQIKIGIDVGYANVGFYGSDEYFKSYTAIGKVVNLASRLCSTAEPNQILVSNDVVKELVGSNYDFSEIGYRKIKGFESDIIKIHELTSNNLALDISIPICPYGHGILHLDVNEGGIYVLKCRMCNHIHESPEKKKAA